MLEVMIWDVDHGSAAYINTPTGKHIAIDLGVGDMSSGEEFSPVEHLSEYGGVERLDLLVITHPHRDHIDDIGNIHLLDPRYILVNRKIDDDDIYAGNKEADEDVIGQYKDFIDGYSPPGAGGGKKAASPIDWGCRVKTFHPVYDGPNLNNYSLVTVLTHAGTKIVIPGDNEEASWKSLLEQKAFVEAIKGTGILVASHHGRASGFYGKLFDHFKPYLVLISDTNHGETSVTGNYRHHAKGWKIDSGRKGEVDEDKRYCLTTRDDGNILIKCGTRASDGKNYMNVSTELGAPADGEDD